MINILAFWATFLVVMSLLAIFFNEKHGGSITKEFISSPMMEIISEIKDELKKEKIPLLSEVSLMMALWIIVMEAFLSIVLICIVIPVEIIAFATHICAEMEVALHTGIEKGIEKQTKES